MHMYMVLLTIIVGMKADSINNDNGVEAATTYTCTVTDGTAPVSWRASSIWSPALPSFNPATSAGDTLIIGPACRIYFDVFGTTKAVRVAASFAYSYNVICLMMIDSSKAHPYC